ncbi:MAG: 5-(carboxyamino)imidazole ribonucleotide synthase [Gammaproteobacteria bacterium]
MKVGILGGGQLARMLALAAQPLGIETLCLSATTDTSAKPVSPEIIRDDNSPTQLQDFTDQVDVITYENENIPLEIATKIAAHKNIYPGATALKVAQDRLLEKKCFTQLEINTPQYSAIESQQDLNDAVAEIGLPAVLKSRRFGYDGKGQFIIRTPSDIDQAWQTLGNQALILEQFIPFQTEVSIIATCDQQQQIKYYPLIENNHQHGILRLSRAPYENLQLQQQAQLYCQRLCTHLNYVGTLAIEFFLIDGQLLANEIAPRVHNSGHWTIEGADTSQFENHLRAICDLPLGSTASRGNSAMFNCLGELPPINDILAIPGAHFHDYHKQARPQRKLGHITLNTDDNTLFNSSFEQLCPLLGIDSIA